MREVSVNEMNGRVRERKTVNHVFFSLLSSSFFIRVAYSFVPVELSCFEDLSRIKFIFVILYLLGVREKLGVFGTHMRCGPCQSSLSLLVFSSRLFFSFSFLFNSLFSSIDLVHLMLWRIYLLFTPKINEKQPHTLVHCVCTADVAMMRSMVRIRHRRTF